MVERTIVQLVLVNETGDSYYRMRWPGRDLAQQRPNWRIINLDAAAQERILWSEKADLLVLIQSGDVDLLPIIEQRRKWGLKTLIEYNDNYYAPPAWSPVAKPWQSPLVWQSYESIMNAGDGLLVTGPGLEQLFAPKCSKPIYTLENHFPHQLKPFDTLWGETAKEIRIGWAGSLGHMADLISVLPTLVELTLSHPRAVLHLMGNETIPEMVKLPKEKFRYTPWGGMDEYFKFWEPIHIGVAPLLSTDYNRCRSDIKAVEMAGCGVLPILQNALPYQQFIKETSAPHFSDYNTLRSVISRLLNDEKEAKAIAKQGYEYVATKRYSPTREERAKLFERHLPEQPSDFIWPLPLGYHELEGTKENSTRTFTALTQVQSAWNKGSKAEAVQQLSSLLQTNPHNAEWAFALAKLGAVLSPERLAEEVSNFSKQFPRDLRFQLLLAVRGKGELRYWEQLVGSLEQAPAASQNFFGQDTVRAYSRELPLNPTLSQLADRLLALYPESAQLRFTLSQFYEKTGNTQRAIEQLTWLSEKIPLFEQNKDFLSSIELSYISAWLEGLNARS